MGWSARLERVTRFAIAAMLVWGLVMGLVHEIGIVSDVGDALAAPVALAVTAVAYSWLGLWRIGRYSIRGGSYVESGSRRVV